MKKTKRAARVLQLPAATFATTWRNKWLTAHAKTIGEMVAALQSAASELKAMAKAGVILDNQSPEDDYARLTTTDPKVAKRFKFETSGCDEFDEFER
jgi:hypothetical protein